VGIPHARALASEAHSRDCFMRIELHQSWDDLRPLSGAWNRLLAESASDTIFLTWEWCDAWWKAYGCNRSLFVLTAWEDGELVGVVPLYKDRLARWGKRWTRLLIIGDGSGDSDYLDIFTKIGREREVLASCCQFLESARDQWDWIQIEGIACASPLIDTVVETAKETGWKSVVESVPCASIRLPESWTSYLARLRPRMRTKVRSVLCYTERHLALAPAECNSVEELDAWLDQLFELHSRRWERKDRPGVFRSAERRIFYRLLSRSTLQKDWLALHRLNWGERPLAMQFGFRYGKHFYVLQEGYDPSFSALRPGSALRAFVIRDAIARGMHDYDFLAGNARHKLDWGASEKFSQRLLIANNTAASWISMSLPHLSSSMRGRVGRLVPASIRAWRREILVGHNKLALTGRNVNGSSKTERLLRWSASHLYSETPLGMVSRSLADHYPSSWFADHASGTGAHTASTCAIFRYHRVNDQCDPFFDALSISQFCAQIEYLVRHCRVVSLDQIYAGQVPQNGSKCPVAITFDDGYRDNFVHAFPILKRMGIPATIFLTTGFIDSGCLPWYDQVRLAFKLTSACRLSMESAGGPSAVLNTEADRLRASKLALEWLRRAGDSDRILWLAELFRVLRVPRDLNLPATMLTWEEVRKMSKAGVSFGAHTVTHPVLGSLSPTRLHEEVAGSKKTIEDRLQLPAPHFAYPFGKHTDFGVEAKHVVHQAGFQTAVTTISGVNRPNQDLLELKRIGINETDNGLFGLKFDWSRAFGSDRN